MRKSGREERAHPAHTPRGPRGVPRGNTRRPLHVKAEGERDDLIRSMLDLAGKYALDTECERTPLARFYRGYRRADGVPVLAKLQSAERPGPLELARFRHDHAMLASLELAGLARPHG